MSDPQLGDPDSVILDQWFETPLVGSRAWKEEAPDWLRDIATALDHWDVPDPPEDLVDRTMIRAAHPLSATASHGVTAYRNAHHPDTHG